MPVTEDGWVLPDHLTPEQFNLTERRAYAPKEIAFHLGVSEDSILREIQGGLLRAVRVRRSLRVPYDELREYIRRQSAEELFMHRN